MSKQKKKQPRKAPSYNKSGDLQRLQRVMAAAGIGSRRECEIIIEEGRVEVDGQVIAELGVKVDPDRQDIFVDGERLVAERLQYFMLNKPPGVVSTSRDPAGRARVIDLIKTDNRVYNVGRLDQSSEGLILVTNDGDLANRLTHPRYRVEKVYHVQVAGVPAPSELKQLEQGVYLAEGKAKASRVRFLKKVKNSSWIEIVLAEGRNREIRRMLASIGHRVRTLRRVAIGPLRLRDLPLGAHRRLTAQELRALKRSAYGETRGPAETPKKRQSTPSSKAPGKKAPGKKAPSRKPAARGRQTDVAESPRDAATKSRRRSTGNSSRASRKTPIKGQPKGPRKGRGRS
jgi:23S rRNA pseudouridine2605 synthase